MSLSLTPLRAWAVCALLFLGPFLAYAPLLHQPFLGDDVYDIVLNPSVQASAPAWAYFFAPRTGSTANNLSEHNWRPLAALTFRALAHVGSEELLIFRAASLAAFAVCGVLVFWLSLSVLEDTAGAALVAGLFLVHPANEETVAFAIGLRSTLSLLLLLAALLSRARSGGRGGAALAFQGACLVLALGYKETAIVLPGLLWAYDRWILKRPMRWVEYAFWTALVLAYLWARRLAAVPLETGRIVLTPWERFLLPPATLFRADLPDLFWPWNTHPLYHQIYFAGSAWSSFWPIALAGAAWCAAYVVLTRRRPKARFACAWIFLGLAPTLGLLPGVDYQADRYLLYATAGAALLAGVFAAERPALKWAFMPLCGLLLLRSRAWVPSYASEASLTEAVYARHPDDPEAALEAAMQRMAGKNIREGEEALLRQAAAPGVFVSTRVRALYLLGCLEAARGRYREALGLLEQTEALDPSSQTARMALSRVRAQAAAPPVSPADFWPPPEGPLF